MGKVCSIICGAPYEEIELSLVEGLVIAADRGLDNALRAGITPNLCVGDFDSAECPVPDGVECVRVRPEKDDTDTMLAADIAIERGYTELRFFCALGGRLDHTFANVQMLCNLLERNIKASIIGRNERVYLLRGEISVQKYEGYLSLFSYTNECVVSMNGVKYPVERHRFTADYPLGVSNEIIAESATITVHEGTALVVERKGFEQ